MQSKTVMSTDDTGTRIDIEYESGRKIGNVHIQNNKLKPKEVIKEVIFRYPDNPNDDVIVAAIKASNIFNRSYNLNKSDKVTFLKGQIKKAIRLMNDFAEKGYCAD